MENTPRSKVRQANSPKKELVGIPDNLLCHSTDVMEFMGWHRETWDMMRAAGEAIGIKFAWQPGTRTEVTSTRLLHRFFEAQPTMPERPSLVKAKAKAKEKAEAKAATQAKRKRP